VQDFYEGVDFNYRLLMKVELKKAIVARGGLRNAPEEFKNVASKEKTAGERRGLPRGRTIRNG